jgi:hypothetical protein
VVGGGPVSEQPQVCPDCGGTGRRKVLNRATGEHHNVRCQCTYDDLPLRVVYQPERSGCAIAAAATVAGKSYAEVRQMMLLERDFNAEGADTFELQSLLDQLGFAYQIRYATVARLGHIPRDPWPCAPWAPLHICTVKNLSDTGYHFVVLLPDGRVLDPWWGVVQGLHRYPRVTEMMGLYPVARQEAA